MKPGRTVNPEAAESLLADIRNFPKTDAGWHRFPDKGWLQQQGAKYGKTEAWGSMTLKGLEAKGRLQVVREGRAVRGAILLDTAQPEPQAAAPTVAEPQPATGTQPEAEEPTALRDRLLQVLQRHSDEKGRVRLGIDDIRARTRTNRHDTIKALGDLVARGQLSWREVHGSGKSKDFTNLRLQGDAVPKQAPKTEVMGQPWSICPDCWWDRRYHRKGTDDATVLICPNPPKSGSPRWQARSEPKPVGSPVRSRQHGNGGHRAPERREPPSPVVTYYECHEPAPGAIGRPPHPVCGQRFSDPVGLRMHKEAKHSGEPLPQNLKPAPDQPETVDVPVEFTTSDPVAAKALDGSVVHVVGWADYPLLTEVARVYHARQRARALLEAAGDRAPIQQLLGGPVGEAGTGARIADEITRLLAALGYEGATDDK